MSTTMQMIFFPLMFAMFGAGFWLGLKVSKL